MAPLLEFSLETRAGALQALPVFAQKIEQLARQRGELGAFQARIGVAVKTLQAGADNLRAASGRIMDTDVAEQSAGLARAQILQQAGAAVLAQANQQPALALQLLGKT